jgi:phosphoenolpyruvate carboxylase
MSQVLDSQLTGTVRNLGAVLGDTIRDQLGEQWLERIEAVRKDGRKAHQGDEDCAKRVKLLFSELKNDELLTVGRAFSQFLNLANIAEQEFNSNNDQVDPIDTL